MHPTDFEKYRVGIEEIDEEHLQLFAYLHAAIFASEQGDTEECSIQLKKFKDLFIAHSQNELHYMATFGCPFIPTHRAEHELLTKAVTKIIDTEPDVPTYDEIVHLTHVVSTHMLTYDKLYVDYARAFNPSKNIP